MGDEKKEEERRLVLVARKGGFGLPSACPSCLSVYFYLRFANTIFDLEFDVNFPDADHIPYVELGDAVFFNTEKGGVIEGLKGEGIVDLDSKNPSLSFPEWVSTKAMISSWLAEAMEYELWVSSDGNASRKQYFSDLPWPIGKVLQWKKSRAVEQRFGITSLNGAEMEEELYRKAGIAYEALSLRLGDELFFFEIRPTSVDALFLGHAVFVLHAFPDTSVLRSNLLKHGNLVKYSEIHIQLLGASSSSPSVPRSPLDASTSSTPRRKSYFYSSSKPKPKAKKERTEEEKTFKRRAKYFLAAQMISVLVFLALFGGSDDAELDDDGNRMDYEI